MSVLNKTKTGSVPSEEEGLCPGNDVNQNHCFKGLHQHPTNALIFLYNFYEASLVNLDQMFEFVVRSSSSF